MMSNNWYRVHRLEQLRLRLYLKSRRPLGSLLCSLLLVMRVLVFKAIAMGTNGLFDTISNRAKYFIPVFTLTARVSWLLGRARTSMAWLSWALRRIVWRFVCFSYFIATLANFSKNVVLSCDTTLPFVLSLSRRLLCFPPSWSLDAECSGGVGTWGSNSGDLELEQGSKICTTLHYSADVLMSLRNRLLLPFCNKLLEKFCNWHDHGRIA